MSDKSYPFCHPYTNIYCLNARHKYKVYTQINMQVNITNKLQRTKYAKKHTKTITCNFHVRARPNTHTHESNYILFRLNTFS